MNPNYGESQQKQIIGKLKWPSIHQSIQYINKGLYTSQDIQPHTFLIVAEFSQIINQHSLPKFFKRLSHLKEVNQIALYVLILKNMKCNEALDPKLKQWLNSQSKGFVSFSQKLIKNSNDLQLFIQYAATKNHYFILAKRIYQDQLAIQILKMYIDVPIFQQFLNMFIIASQFCNTRAFGYTKDYLLIPGLDYLNYDPSKDSNNITFISFQQFQQVTKQIQRQKQQQDAFQQSQNSNSQQEEQDNCDPTKKYIGIYNKRTIKAGEQLLFNYGGLQNRRLLSSYGFTIKNNPNDFVIIYVSKYQSDKMIFFSQVQRSTAKFKIRYQKICTKLVNFWIKLHQNDKKIQQKQINQPLHQLILQLQNFRPPIIHEQDKKVLQNQFGYKFLITYQQQQLKIYQNQIQLLKQILNLQKMDEKCQKYQLIQKR